LPPTSGCSKEFGHDEVNSTWAYSASLSEVPPCQRLVSDGPDVAPLMPSTGSPWPTWLPERTTSETGQDERRGCMSPDPQRRGRHPSYFKFPLHENCATTPQPSLVADGDCGIDVGNAATPWDCSTGCLAPFPDDRRHCLNASCLPLSSLKSDSQHGALRGIRGEGSPDSYRRPVAETIKVLSLAGELLCTLDGSAKLLPLRGIQFLIKAHTGIYVDCQELLNGTERLSDVPGVDARPLAEVRGPITLSLVKVTPLPRFGALV
jgi:hypothetical protein